MINQDLLEVEKILEVPEQYSVKKFKPDRLPSQKYNVIILGDDTENSAKSILGLNEYSTILAYEDIKNQSKVFQVWEQHENPQKDLKPQDPESI